MIKSNRENEMRVIDQPLLDELVRKYVDAFTLRFPHRNIEVHFSANALPPLPSGIQRYAPPGVVGACIRAGKTILIGVHNDLKFPARLSTFFHEYGHAIFKANTGEDDS